MKKNVLLIITLLFLSPTLNAGLKLTQVSNITFINDYCIGATWSPDGKKIVFSKTGFNGLYVINSDGAWLTELTDEPNSGFRPIWFSDSSGIIYRAVVLDDEGRIQERYLSSVELKTGKKISITQKLDWVSLPWYSEDKGVIFSAENKLQSSNSQVTKTGSKIFGSPKVLKENTPANVITQIPSTEKIVMEDDDGITIFDLTDNQKQTICKNGLNDLAYGIRVSPDKTKLLYHNNVENVMHLYVTDLLTNKTTDLGEGFDACWLQDSKYILYCIAQNDGYDLTSSEMYVVNTESFVVTKITDTMDQIEIYPAVSPDGKKVIYTDHKSGKLFIGNLEESK